MSSSAKLLGSKVDASYSVVITCDFKADLSDKYTRKTFPLRDVPLAGDWSLDLKGADDGVSVWVSHTYVPVGRLGACVDCEYTLYWSDSGVLKVVDSNWWNTDRCPSVNDSGSAHTGSKCLETGDQAFRQAHRVESFDPKGERRYRLVFELRQEFFKPTPHNFRLFFPNLGQDGASLWINAELLSHFCPYFKDLLASDFAEAAPRRSKRPRVSGAQPVDVQQKSVDRKDFDDSDDETDDFRFECCRPDIEEPPDDLSFREITVTQTAFSTYHALLVFLQTGYLRFAPLKSACKPSNPAGIKTWSELVKKACKKDTYLPLPVSPKSLYRLVNLLRVPESTGLAVLCLDAIADSLTFDGAAVELFNDTSRCFEPIRKVILAYVATNWDEVSETPSWKDYAAKIKAGELPEAAGIMLELVEVLKTPTTKKK
ncbi:hypothetical protein JCM10207_009184 [Rhodosporidiobolus poonsookiae]